MTAAYGACSRDPRQLHDAFQWTRYNRGPGKPPLLFRCSRRQVRDPGTRTSPSQPSSATGDAPDRPVGNDPMDDDDSAPEQERADGNGTASSSPGGDASGESSIVEGQGERPVGTAASGAGSDGGPAEAAAGASRHGEIVFPQYMVIVQSVPTSPPPRR